MAHENKVVVDMEKCLRPIKQKAYSTMCNMRKQDLIDYIRKLEQRCIEAERYIDRKELHLPKESAEGILIGGTYRHFKGKEYVAMGVAVYTETGEPVVIYGDETGRIWARPKRDFLSIVKRNGQKYRFELVEDEA